MAKKMIMCLIKKVEMYFGHSVKVLWLYKDFVTLFYFGHLSAIFRKKMEGRQLQLNDQ